jgi:putative Mg2+ transporter-C (MgtC) family protein
MLDAVITRLAADTTLSGLPPAFLPGAIIGAEREWRQNAASLRSCVLVSVTGFADLMATRVPPAGLGSGFGAQESVGAIWLTVLVLLINTVLKPVQGLIRRRLVHRSAEEKALEG